MNRSRAHGAKLAGPCLDRGARDVSWIFGDDVDHPVERIKSVNHRGRTLEYFNLLNLQERDRQRFPRHQSLRIDIGRAAVD